MSAVEVLTTYLADPDVGDKVVQALRALCARKPEFYDVVVEPAKFVFEDGLHRESVAYLLGDCVSARDLEHQVIGLLPRMMAHHSQMMGIPTHRPSKGAVHAILALAKVTPGSVIDVLRSDLRRGDKYSRLRACDSLEFLIDEYPDIGKELLEPLLASLVYEEDMYERSADGATIELISRIAQRDLTNSLAVVDGFYEDAVPEVKAILLRFYAKLVTAVEDKGVHDHCIVPVILALVAGIEHIEVLIACAELVEDVSRRSPEVLMGKLDRLINALAFQANRPMEIHNTKAKDLIEGLERERHAAEWSRVVSDIRKAIVNLGRHKPAVVGSLLVDVIRRTSSKTEAEFKAELIDALGEIGKRDLSVAQLSVPLLFGLLVDNDAALVRGNAAEALGNVSSYQADILPDDVLELLKELLLHETNVYVLTKLFYAFQHIRVVKVELATAICNALVSWERSFQDEYRQEEIIDTLLDVAQEFDGLRLVVKPWFWRYCHHKRYWIRRQKLEQWFRWSSEYSEFTLNEFIAASLQLFRDFPDEIRDLASLKQPYEDLLSVQRQHFAEHVQAIVDLGKSQRGHYIWNKREFAVLLSVKEYYAASSELYQDLVDSLPKQPRYDKTRRYYAVLAYHGEAEDAVIDQNIAKALATLEKASKLIDNEGDLQQGQVALRLELLRCLAAFDLVRIPSFCAEIERLQQQYSTILQQHEPDILAVDERFFHSVDHLLASLVWLGKWAVASLGADANAVHFLEAAQQHGQLAVDLAHQTDSTLYAEMAQGLQTVLQRVRQVGDITVCVREVALIPFPLIPEYRVKANWNGAKSRRHLLAENGIDPEDATSEQVVAGEDVSVAKVSMSVDGLDLTQPITIYAGMAHGLHVGLQFARWPAKYGYLQLRLFSTSQLLSGHLFQPIERPTLFDGGISVDSHLLFEHPLSPAAPPFQANLVASLVAEGDEHVLDLFGNQQLTVRVLERRDALWQRIEPRLNVIEEAVKLGMSDLKRGQSAIYAKVSDAYKEPLAEILDWVRSGHMMQGEMQRMLDAIRRALRLMQETGGTGDLQEALKAQKEAVESTLNLQQKLELTLPLIPVFLNYKIELGAGSTLDLNQLRTEVANSWNALAAKAAGRSADSSN